jgi:hypothetical protein
VVAVGAVDVAAGSRFIFCAVVFCAVVFCAVFGGVLTGSVHEGFPSSELSV